MVMTDQPPNPENKRRQIRHPLTGDLTGSVISARTGSLVPCVARDVSQSGLRIVIGLDLAEGTELILRLHGTEARLAVVWCRKEDSKKGYFSCGLLCNDPHIDLYELFTQDGWVGGVKR